MKVLLDTNVLLSAAWRDRLPERVVQYVATNPDVQWIVTQEITSEYIGVLQRPKFGLSADTLTQWADLVALRTIVVRSPTLDIGKSELRDPKDAIFLAAALASDADFLVTGDNDLFQAKAIVATRIVTVAQFATEFHIQ